MKKLEWSLGAQIPDGLSVGDLAGLASESEAMDARLFLRNDAGDVMAWASLWWRDTPELNGNKVGAIGGFGANDESSALELIDAAVGKLQEFSCSTMVGPMNGNTWRSYRHVVESYGRGAFLLEPRNPSAYPDWWKAAGFTELAGYSSSLVPLDGKATVPETLAARLASAGVVIRNLDSTRFEEDLESIHSVTLAGFSSNFLYTPLPKEAFMAAYLKIREKVDPQFVRIAERDGKPCGYVFAIADYEAMSRGEKPALIIKTLTVDPSARCAGLGSLLVDEVQRRGYNAGFREAIHALQYDGNTVLRITSRHGGSRIRRYALYSKSL